LRDGRWADAVQFPKQAAAPDFFGVAAACTTGQTI
jgi:hypothetical protein